MDGQHGGNVTATFSDYGVSASCPLNIPLVITAPGTFVNGNDRLCETQTYALSSPLPSGASATWAVSPPSAPVYPLSGSGTSATISPTGSGANATITFTVSGCNLTETFDKDIFVGRPNIYGHLIDGVPGTNQYVCPGWHLLIAQVQGDDSHPPCLTWELFHNTGTPPHILWDVNCDWASVYFQDNGAPAIVKVTADNECGAYSSYFYLFPKWTGCGQEYLLNVYPNPASNVLNFEVLLDDGTNVTNPAIISHAQLINTMGVIVQDIPNIETGKVEMDLSNIPNGLYIARANVGEEWMNEMVQISKN